jgi:hypothetical protein
MKEVRRFPNMATLILQQSKTNLWTSEEKGTVWGSRTLTFHAWSCSSFDYASFGSLSSGVLLRGKGKFQGGGGGDNLTVSVNHRETVSLKDRGKGGGGGGDQLAWGNGAKGSYKSEVWNEGRKTCCRRQRFVKRERQDAPITVPTILSNYLFLKIRSLSQRKIRVGAVWAGRRNIDKTDIKK